MKANTLFAASSMYRMAFLLWRPVGNMETTIDVAEASEQFPTIMDRVQYQKDRLVVSSHGKPAVAVVPLEIYENWKQQRQRLFNLIREVQAANPDADPDEVMQNVMEAQQTVRIFR
jgi:prevent-host-death family protein